MLLFTAVFPEQRERATLAVLLYYVVMTFVIESNFSLMTLLSLFTTL